MTLCFSSFSIFSSILSSTTELILCVVVMNSFYVRKEKVITQNNWLI